MSAASVNVDCMNTKVVIGDWLLQPGHSSMAAPIKFCQVVSLTKTGKVRVIGFEYYKVSENEYNKTGVQFVWFHSADPYTLTRVDKTYCVPVAGLPPLLLAYIESDMCGTILGTQTTA